MAEGVCAHVSRIILAVACLWYLADAQTQCYECDHVASANDCGHTTVCSSTQQCYTQRFIGAGLNEYYTSGCQEISVCNQAQFSLFGMMVGKRTTPAEFRSRSRRDTGPMVTCMQCCTGMLCNKALCGSADTNMRRCFECSDVMTPHDCDKITECSRDDYCFVHKGPHPVNGQYRYEMKCQLKSPCETIAALSDIQTGCTRCCQSGDYCNFNACDNWTATATTPTTPTRPTTTTTTLPTAPAPTITGTPVVHYGQTAFLKCIVTHNVQSIVWYYNKTQALPPGASIIADGLLKVMNVTESNSGSYTCVVTAHSGLTSRKDATVTIATAVAEVITVEREPIHVTAGGPFAIKCTVAGWPRPTVTWDYISANAGGHTIPSGVIYSADKLTLFIATYISAHHDGTWKCKASNFIGSSEKAVNMP